MRNAATSYVATALSMGTAFFVTPLLVRYLGAEQFGLWALLVSAAAYFGLLDVGIGTAVVKRVAECHATGDKRRLECVLSTAAAIYLSVAVVILLATTVTAPFLLRVFQIDTGLSEAASLTFVVLGASQAVVFFFHVQTTILFGAGRLDVLTKTSMVVSALTAGTNVLFVLQGYGVLSLGLVTFGGALATGVSTHLLIRRHFPETRIHPRTVSWPMARELCHFGSKNVAIAVCGSIAYGADTLIIGAFLPLASVANFAIASKLVAVVRTLATKPLDILTPAYAHSSAIADRERLYLLFSRGVTVSLAITFPLVLAFGVFGRQIIAAWVGPGHDSAYLVLVILAATLLFQLQGHAAYVLMTATEQNIFLLRILAISAPLNLLVSLLLTWKFGIIGPALGSLVTVLFADAVLLPLRTSQQCGFRYADYLRASLGPLAVPALAALATALLLRVAIPSASLWNLAAAGFVPVLFWSLWCGKALMHLPGYSLSARLRTVLRLA